ncbi:hypothetical protein [Streptomyces sp. LN325]|uniref:hypothetical protein n=1 Tax=Streptomyces sp. LN325 TaxID=3112976 RepID=UPI00371C1956
MTLVPRRTGRSTPASKASGSSTSPRSGGTNLAEEWRHRTCKPEPLPDASFGFSVNDESLPGPLSRSARPVTTERPRRTRHRSGIRTEDGGA